MKGASKFKGQSLRGQFLLDGGKLRGSYFHRSVVLICHHDEEGAFGLMVNRASDNKVGELILADLPEQLKEQPLFAGGPVQPAALSYLHHDGFLPDANVLPNLNLGHSLEELVEIGGSFSTTQRIKIFAGYSGWSPGQLEDEMKRESWLTFPATADLVFHTPSEHLWRTIMKQLGWQQQLFADSPEDLSWN
jgi:putative transcriptional regulator